jgi:hypothetical protein
MREWEQKYHQHKFRTERRGIPFELTFQQWLKVWQDSGHCTNADPGKASTSWPGFSAGVLSRLETCGLSAWKTTTVI